DLNLDLNLDFANTSAPPATVDALRLKLPARDSLPSDTPARPALSAAPATVEHGLQAFDLNAISLHLGDSNADATAGSASEPDNDMLETKLALAEEFFDAGDHDGARALLEEVLPEAQGDLHARAQRLLGNLVG
ncbi:MAG: fimbrial protein FimV, partial [Rhodoferax sp.]|nr:fimbrial protein FimV [Rhodoferax sp.]